jgi:hypothetical protein
MLRLSQTIQQADGSAAHFERVFSVMDRDGDKRVDRDEWVRYCVEHVLRRDSSDDTGDRAGTGKDDDAAGGSGGDFGGGGARRDTGDFSDDDDDDDDDDDRGGGDDDDDDGHPMRSGATADEGDGGSDAGLRSRRVGELAQLGWERLHEELARRGLPDRGPAEEVRGER